MSSTSPYFSPDLATAQRRFRSGVAARQGRLDVLKLAARGPRGEELTIDVGWFGAADPLRIFIHSSGLHGVEGFAGSAIQLRCLDEALPPLPANSAIIMVHVLNPYGMAWLRRVNENNVDLNRNFGAANDHGADLERDYLKLDSFLNPQSPPRIDPAETRRALDLRLLRCVRDIHGRVDAACTGLAGLVFADSREKEESSGNASIHAWHASGRHDSEKKEELT